MISVNATIFIQVIHFLLMVFILNRLMLRPVMRQIDGREEHIVQARKDAEDLAAEAERLARERADMERNARKGAAGERTALKEEASSAAEAIFEDTRKEVAAIRERADQEIQSQVEKAKAALDQEVAVLADEIAEKIAGRRVNS
ncbi:MAG: ATP synthase F0 subunit B [Deltaproteobacteria bacterium]|nr:ATP synthase F0 subunit B [Deltaproteobacteria bacterium]